MNVFIDRNLVKYIKTNRLRVYICMPSPHTSTKFWMSRGDYVSQFTSILPQTDARREAGETLDSHVYNKEEHSIGYIKPLESCLCRSHTKKQVYLESQAKSGSLQKSPNHYQYYKWGYDWGWGILYSPVSPALQSYKSMTETILWKHGKVEIPVLLEHIMFHLWWRVSWICKSHHLIFFDTSFCQCTCQQIRTVSLRSTK